MKYLLMIIVMVLVGINLWVGNLLKKSNTENYDLEAENSNIKYNYNSLKESLLKTLQLEDTQIKDSIVESDNKIISLRELLGKSTKLIFRFDENSCNPCIKRELINIAEAEKTMGPDKILIIAGFEDKKKVIVMLNNMNIKSKFLCIKRSQQVTAYDKEFIEPYLFVVNNNLNIRNLFFPTQKDDDLSFQYFNFIKSVTLNQKI